MQDGAVAQKLKLNASVMSAVVIIILLVCFGEVIPSLHQ
jgi:hypothetical protein